MTGDRQDVITMDDIRRLAVSFPLRPTTYVAICSPEALVELKRNGFIGEAGWSRVMGLNVLFCTEEQATFPEAPIGKITFNTLEAPRQESRAEMVARVRSKKQPWRPPVERARWQR